MFDDVTGQEGETGIKYSVDDENSADNVNTVGAGNKSLEKIYLVFRHSCQLKILTAVKSAPKKPCSIPDQIVRGMTRI